MNDERQPLVAEVGPLDGHGDWGCPLRHTVHDCGSYPEVYYCAHPAGITVCRGLDDCPLRDEPLLIRLVEDGGTV